MLERGDTESGNEDNAKSADSPQKNDVPFQFHELEVVTLPDSQNVHVPEEIPDLSGSEFFESPVPDLTKWPPSPDCCKLTFDNQNRMDDESTAQKSEPLPHKVHISNNNDDIGQTNFIQISNPSPMTPSKPLPKSKKRSAQAEMCNASADLSNYPGHGQVTSSAPDEKGKIER